MRKAIKFALYWHYILANRDPCAIQPSSPDVHVSMACKHVTQSSLPPQAPSKLKANGEVQRIRSLEAEKDMQANDDLITCSQLSEISR